MLEKIYDKYDFDQDYEVYKYGQQVLIFNSIVNIFSILLSPGNDLKGIATIKPNKTDNCFQYDFAKILNNKQATKVIIPKSKFLAEPKLSL